MNAIKALLNGVTENVSRQIDQRPFHLSTKLHIIGKKRLCSDYSNCTILHYSWVAFLLETFCKELHLLESHKNHIILTLSIRTTKSIILKVEEKSNSKIWCKLKFPVITSNHYLTKSARLNLVSQYQRLGYD